MRLGVNAQASEMVTTSNGSSSIDISLYFSKRSSNSDESDNQLKAQDGINSCSTNDVLFGSNTEAQRDKPIEVVTDTRSKLDTFVT